jgi:hypothetical protein
MPRPEDFMVFYMVSDDSKMTDVEKFCVQCLSCNVANQMTKPNGKRKKVPKKPRYPNFSGKFVQEMEDTWY